MSPALARLLERLDVAALADELVAARIGEDVLGWEEACSSTGTARAQVQLVLRLLQEPAEAGACHRERAQRLARDQIALGTNADTLIAGWRSVCEHVWQAAADAASDAELAVLANAAPRLFGALAIVTEQLDEHRRRGGDERAALERDHRAAYDMLLAGRSDASLLHGLGVDLGGDLRAFELMLPTRGAWLHAEAARDLRGQGALAATGHDRVCGFWPAARDLAAIVPGAAVVAVGPAAGPGAAAGTVRAVSGLADVALRAGRTGVLEHTELLPERLLHASPHVVRVLHTRVIEPLTRANGNADLLATLVTFVRCDRDRRRTAAQLGVHRNTLDYRLGRIAELTGLSLQSANDLAMLGLAAQLAAPGAR